MSEEAQSLSYGQKAVGISFNPSNDPTVQRLKELYADIVDICHGMTGEVGQENSERSELAKVAIRAAQDAQMWAVKAATWKD